MTDKKRQSNYSDIRTEELEHEILSLKQELYQLDCTHCVAGAVLKEMSNRFSATYSAWKELMDGWLWSHLSEDSWIELCDAFILDTADYIRDEMHSPTYS